MRPCFWLFGLQLLLSSLCPVHCEQRRLSRQEKRELLDAHNHLRSIVDPPATDMQRMVQRMEWREELAAVAQDYAEECVFGHNRHRSNRSLPFPYVGENIAITNNPLTNPRDLVHGWYNESQYYDAVAKECEGKECRHYTQVVWASSAWVGCGIQRCDSTVGFPHASSTILICNYGPGGNIAGESPYLAGAVPCSWCPELKPLCQNNLCVATAKEVV